jgi:hypothetical protein
MRVVPGSYAVARNERNGRKAARSQARDAALYARQLAGFGAFTLRRKVWPDQPGELIVDEEVYPERRA